MKQVFSRKQLGIPYALFLLLFVVFMGRLLALIFLKRKEWS